jgi:hypothetical protein
LKIPLLLLCGLFLFGDSALALTFDQTGGVDQLLSYDKVDNGYWDELAWLKSELTSSVVFPEANKYNTTGQWTEVNGYYALELKSMPEYFYIKIGTGGTDIKSDHFLYRNDPESNWAVIDPKEWLNPLNNIVYAQASLQNGLPRNIDTLRISHLGEINQVAEPTTMLLLGAGLIGLAGWGRKKFKKN